MRRDVVGIAEAILVVVHVRVHVVVVGASCCSSSEHVSKSTDHLAKDSVKSPITDWRVSLRNWRGVVPGVRVFAEEREVHGDLVLEFLEQRHQVDVTGPVPVAGAL